MLLLLVDNPPVQVLVPDVVGSSRDPAVAAIEAAGLDVSISTQDHPTADVGLVLAQSPPAGTSVNIGTTVSITIVTRVSYTTASVRVRAIRVGMY